MSERSNLSQMPLDLGDNLILRFARPDDVDALAEFNARISDDQSIGVWTRDLTSGRHPTTQASDFTVVEDTCADKIVSAMGLISQTWAYGGIPFNLGRPEIVNTDPDYRRRGLVRKQFEVIHALSASRGELMQAISGISWFYRQFGYEMTMNRFGTRSIYSMHIPKFKEGETEKYRLRTAIPEDHSFICEVYDHAIRRQPFAALRTPEQWKYEFSERSNEIGGPMEWLIIEAADGEPLGFAQCYPSGYSDRLPIFLLELKPGANYLNVMPSLLRGFWEKAQRISTAGDEKLEGLAFALGLDHPAYHALPKSSAIETKPWTWYIRVPDLLTFLRHIRPALETNLIGTIAEGYTGELRLNFYRSGIQLRFDQGKITKISDWSPETVFDGEAKFPDLTFLQLLCGRQRFEELADNFADCEGTHEAAVLLDCLFPPFTGHVWALN